MVHALALGTVLLAGLYLVLLAAATIVAPARTTRFLLGFAGTARAHYAELTMRFLIGVGFVVQAPRMRFGDMFVLFGWVLLLTTLGLALVPWRWHRELARRVVPYAIRHLWLLGGASLMLGGLVLAAAFPAAT